ncbi:MAG: hypothetical protein GTN89_00845 [Acidobacteria bacterium]|nr:hypothetical protein [Acidobacteriota bacterium]NIM60654.1 hypothetical protein [Acidobacteriota bacterium]NIO57941.1 hypothetical protein [Acidobacteriota bacterium]NIQ28944.1 hypothetical protein [Acidobacteriota bacterium]NIQ83418.1 hypothetical protein [Acidobacteriota bacterium]
MRPLWIGLVLAAAWLPAGANCVSSHPISTANGTDPAYRSFIWTSTVFEPFYFPTYAPLDYQPPITPQLQASFWLSGMGDPAIGAGHDNGSRDLSDPAVGDLAYQSDPFPVYFGAELDSDWSFPGIDGCPPAGGCTCLLLSDVDAQQRHGLFALVGAANDPVGGTFFNLTGSDPLGNGLPIVLREVPRPVVTDVQRPQADTVEITVTVRGRAAGVYDAASGAGCACGPTEFLVRQRVLPRDSVPPTGRTPTSWAVAPLVGGGAQTPTPVDGSVTVESTCPGGDTDVYLVTELFFDSGFSTAFVSGNSIPVECGGNLSGEFLLDVRTLFEQPRPRGKNR